MKKYEFTGQTKQYFGITLHQFRQKVIETHGENSKHGKLYLGMANMIEFRLEVPPNFQEATK